MQKLLLISVIAMSIAFPAIAARSPSARLGLRKTLVWCLVGIFAYVLALLVIFPHLSN